MDSGEVWQRLAPSYRCMDLPVFQEGSPQLRLLFARDGGGDGRLRVRVLLQPLIEINQFALLRPSPIF